MVIYDIIPPRPPSSNPSCLPSGSAQLLFSSSSFWDTAQLAVGKMSSKQRVKRFPLSKVKVKQLKAETPTKALDYFAFCIRKLLRLATEGAERLERSLNLGEKLFRFVICTSQS